MSEQRVSVPKITLEQWAAFKAVVDEGSYARAADALSKSQSSISYAVSRLNTMLPTPALVVKGRKAVLTLAGASLYRHADNLLSQAYATEQAARYLASGWESSITLVSDALAPMDTILCALQAFSEISPLTRIKVIETALSGTDEAVLNHACDLAIMARVPPGFLGNTLVSITMLAVAHKEHPLSQRDSVSEAELKAFRQIVVRDSGTRREQNAGWLGSEQRWTVSHFATSVDAVKAGLGFAFLPEHRIRESLASGELRQLALETGRQRSIPLSLVITDPNHAGPATKTIAKTLEQAFEQNVPSSAHRRD